MIINLNFFFKTIGQNAENQKNMLTVDKSFAIMIKVSLIQLYRRK